MNRGQVSPFPVRLALGMSGLIGIIVGAEILLEVLS